MISEYENPKVSKLFSDFVKLTIWQKTELAVIKAMFKLNIIDRVFYDQINKSWSNNPIDIKWWKIRGRAIHNDFNAFLNERYRYLPTGLPDHVYRQITSCDTEEASFVLKLQLGWLIVRDYNAGLTKTLTNLALKYRYTIMNGRTHGQEVELQSFGARVLTWLKDLQTADRALSEAKNNLRYSQISGGISKYKRIDPLLEKKVLNILKLKPYYGSTQTMLTLFYAPFAQALCNVVMVVDKIATDIRFFSQSSRALMQVTFPKKQTVFSAMSFENRPIALEQIEGLAQLAIRHKETIAVVINPGEKGAIKQLSVEQVAWHDLFNVVCRSLITLNKALGGLEVYPDNMLKEIHESHGVYASSEIKKFLRENSADLRLSDKEIEQMVQLATLNVCQLSPNRMVLRETISDSFAKSQQMLFNMASLKPEYFLSLRNIFPAADLEFTNQLNITQKKVNDFNNKLKKIFWQKSPEDKSGEVIDKWEKIFSPEFLLKNEDNLYKEIFGA